MTLDELIAALPDNGETRWGVHDFGERITIYAERGIRVASKSVSTIHLEHYRDIAVQDIVRDLIRELS